MNRKNSRNQILVVIENRFFTFWMAWSRDDPGIWSKAWRDSPKDPGLGINVRGGVGKEVWVILGGMGCCLG